MHEKKPRPKPTEEEPAEKDKAWEKPQPDWLRCKVCNKVVKGEEALKMHMKTSSRCGAYRGESTRDPCPLCGKMISKGEWPEGLPCCREAKAVLRSRSRSPKRKADVVDVEVPRQSPCSQVVIIAQYLHVCSTGGAPEF